MLLQNVILSFPQVFKAKKIAGSDKARYGVNVLIHPTHPQFAQLTAEFNRVKNEAFPSGLSPKDDVCFESYDDKYRTKDYYDPKLTGWWNLSLSRGEDQGPPDVVEMNRDPVINQGKVFPGQLAHVHFNIFSYKMELSKGIAGGLNGIMITDQEGSLGRLDSRPSVDSMFKEIWAGAPVAGPPGAPVGGPPPIQQAAPPAPPAAPPAPPAPPAVGPQFVMTVKAGTYTREAYHASGWTDDSLIAAGMMTRMY